MKLLSTRKLNAMNGVTLLLCAVSIQFANGTFFMIPETGYEETGDEFGPNPETQYHVPVSAPSNDDYFEPQPYPTASYPTAYKPGVPTSYPVAYKPYKPPTTASYPTASYPTASYPTAYKPGVPTSYPVAYKPYKPPTRYFVKPTERPTLQPTFRPTERPTPVPTPRPTVSAIRGENCH